MFAHLFRPYRGLLIMAVAASVMAPSSLVAQQPAAEPVVAVTAAATTSSLLFTPPGPAARELFPVASDAWALNQSPEPVLPGGDVRSGPNVALMIVGGAALVTGLVIGGDGGLVIATSGAVVGLLGLYRYLR